MECRSPVYGCYSKGIEDLVKISVSVCVFLELFYFHTLQVFIPLSSSFVIEGNSYHQPQGAIAYRHNTSSLILIIFCFLVLKRNRILSPIFHLSFAAQSLFLIFSSAVGSGWIFQYLQALICIVSLHFISVADQKEFKYRQKLNVYKECYSSLIHTKLKANAQKPK